MDNQIEQQLNELRNRLEEIRTAKKWLQEFRINAPVSVSAALASYYHYLIEQESRTIQMGKRLKGEKH